MAEHAVIHLIGGIADMSVMVDVMQTGITGCLRIHRYLVMMQRGQ